ncbi:MAG: hypothetical protein KGJ07_05765 [Patescibacteria group bacterium]|nr:hypothetical protein [Patescibacteria group bacterium]MDE2591047.1 hypothetical protein [Patescibacteria group bacterium]
MKRLIIILYFGVLIALTAFSYLFIDPNLSYLKFLYTGFAFTKPFFTTVIYCLFLILLFTFYGAFLFLEKKEKLYAVDLRNLFIGVVVISLFAYPAMLSYDIFNYVADAKILFHYHENPYIFMATDFIGDPLISFLHNGNNISPYGVFWTLLSGIPFSLGFGNFIATLFAFKGFVIGFYVLTLYILKKITNNSFIVSLFGLNPLVILESLMGGHNDIVMMGLALLALFLLSKKHIFKGVLTLILSILIKYGTIMLLPVYVYASVFYLRKRKVNWENIYFWSALLMFVIFLFSSVRKEIYPWYGQWFLLFAFMTKKTWIRGFALAFSIGLLLRDIPFMLIGNYFGFVQLMKTLFTFIPPMFVLLFFVGKRVLAFSWKKA